MSRKAKLWRVIKSGDTAKARKLIRQLSAKKLDELIKQIADILEQDETSRGNERDGRAETRRGARRLHPRREPLGAPRPASLESPSPRISRTALANSASSRLRP